MDRRFLGMVAGIATAHLVAQIATMLVVVGGLQRFDGGQEAGVLETVAGAAAWFLHLPLVTLARMLPLGGTGHWGWALLVANSLVWGLAMAGLWRWWTGRRTAGQVPTGRPIEAGR